MYIIYDVFDIKQNLSHATFIVLVKWSHRFVVVGGPQKLPKPVTCNIFITRNLPSSTCRTDIFVPVKVIIMFLPSLVWKNVGCVPIVLFFGYLVNVSLYKQWPSLLRRIFLTNY